MFSPKLANCPLQVNHPAIKRNKMWYNPYVKHIHRKFTIDDLRGHGNPLGTLRQLRRVSSVIVSRLSSSCHRSEMISPVGLHCLLGACIPKWHATSVQMSFASSSADRIKLSCSRVQCLWFCPVNEQPCDNQCGKNSRRFLSYGNNYDFGQVEFVTR